MAEVDGVEMAEVQGEESAEVESEEMAAVDGADAVEIELDAADENLDGVAVEEDVDTTKPEKEENQENAENMEEEIDKIKSEHYSQTKPEEFCSENFKIELGGLPKYYPLSHLKKLLNNTLQLDAHRVKPGGMGRNVAYLNFKDEDARSKALTVLNDYKWQGATLKAQKADPNKDPLLLAKIDFLKVPKKEHEQLPLNERIQKAVTPYHSMSYEEQIKEKERAVRQVLRKFGNELAQINPELKDFVHWHKIRRKGQICELDDFVESPVKTGYRNKCEFTIGKNKESELPVVGFRVASYKEGTVEVGPVEHLVHINDKMKKVVKLMEQYLSTSKYETFDPFSHLGVWRQLTVRTSQNDDLMIVVVIHPQEMDETEISAIKEDITSFFTVGDGTEAAVTSIFFQQYSQKESGKEVDFEHVYGKTFIEETILGKTFKASPDSFLQVNTPGCEVLYEKIAEIADVDQTTVLLDVCCGVGTIGLSLAECTYKTMGVELTPSAVEDARANAEKNGIANAVFYNGKAEDYIDNMIERTQRANVVAVVDPPRAGLNGSVMNALRKCECLNKLVYVSCDPQAAVLNFQALGRPRSKTYKGSYFVPVRAVPVDLFPDTPHFELVILFERYDECKWDRIMGGNPRPKDQAYFDRVPELTYDPEKDKEREEKRASQRRDRNGKGGRNWGRDRDRDRRRRDNWRRDRDRGGRDRDRDRGGRDRDWGRDRSRGFGSRDRDDDWEGRDDRNGRGNYGEGFQEGFQAALEALQSQNPGFNPGAFNQGGGAGGFNQSGATGNFNQGSGSGNFNQGTGSEDGSYNQGSGGGSYNQGSGGAGYTVAQNQQQGGFGGPPPPPPPSQGQGNMGYSTVSNNQPMNGNQSGGGGSWGYEGYEASTASATSAAYGNTAQDYNTQPVTYPTSVTNPMQNQQGTGYGYPASGGHWVPAQQQAGASYGNQMGSWGQGQYQSYEEPMAKKWKSDGTAQQNTGYDYSSYQ